MLSGDRHMSSSERVRVSLRRSNAVKLLRSVRFPDSAKRAASARLAAIVGFQSALKPRDIYAANPFTWFALSSLSCRFTSLFGFSLAHEAQSLGIACGPCLNCCRLLWIAAILANKLSTWI